VLRDRVFTFYYPENLEELERAGAELLWVNSLADGRLPPVDGLYVGGGFPEVFMEQLEANGSLREDIRLRVEEGLPVYAECAGLIYLSRRIRWGDRCCEMVGALPCDLEMTARPQGHGYAVGEVRVDNPFFSTGTQLKGHEFHHSRVSAIDRGRIGFAYRLTRGSGVDGEHHDGLLVRNVLAAYTHLHALATPEWAERFVGAAERHGSRLASKGGRV
jgi:cobyrinic acid a,c-diamide synthase